MDKTDTMVVWALAVETIFMVGFIVGWLIRLGGKGSTWLSRQSRRKRRLVRLVTELRHMLWYEAVREGIDRKRLIQLKSCIAKYDTGDATTERLLASWSVRLINEYLSKDMDDDTPMSDEVKARLRKLQWLCESALMVVRC